MSELPKTDLLCLSKGELETFFAELGEPKYRAGQLFTQMHRGVSLDAITNISAKTKEKILERGFYSFPRIAQKLVSALDGTVKYAPGGKGANAAVAAISLDTKGLISFFKVSSTKDESFSSIMQS